MRRIKLLSFVVLSLPLICLAQTKENLKFDSAYRKAEKGDSLAQNYVAYCYMNGYGIAKNEQKAAIWYQKSAEQGHSEAQYGIGMYYLQGRGTEKDNKKASEWLLKSANQGYVEAQIRIGN